MSQMVDDNEGSFSDTDSEHPPPPPPPVAGAKKGTRGDADVAAMLLGLASSQAEGSEEDQAQDQSQATRMRHNKRPLGEAELVLEETHPDLTKKGLLRLGPGDNRVRPPKAATKLLPESKWRHIRLPDVDSALEAEDWVVMWAHFTSPDTLPRAKAEGLLNFRLSHYDEEELKKHLLPIKSAYELENVLKERYGVGGGHKKARTLAASASMAVARMAAALQHGSGSGGGGGGPRLHLPKNQTGALANMLHSSDLDLGPLPLQFAVPRLMSSDTADLFEQDEPMMPPKGPKQELAGLNYIGAGLKDGAGGAGKRPRRGENNNNNNTSSIAPGENRNGSGAQNGAGGQQQQQQQQAAMPEMEQQQQQQQQQKEKVEPQIVEVPAANAPVAAAPAPETAQALPVPAADAEFTAQLMADAAAAAAAGAVPADLTQQSLDAMAALLPPGSLNVDLQAIMNQAFPPGQMPAGLPGLAGLAPYQLMPNWGMLNNPLWSLGAGLTLPQMAGTASLLPPFALQPDGGLDGGAAALTGAPPAAGNGGGGGGAGGKGETQKYHNSGDRPGRPPSYDDMVRWCVDLKRCLWQRHIALTIEEAVTMVNDPALCSSAGDLPKAKTLVASTLRKRVLGIYRITWSQVASDADPGASDEITNPSVLAAATAKLKRHGMDLNHMPGATTMRRPLGGAAAPHASRRTTAPASGAAATATALATATAALPLLPLPSLSELPALSPTELPPEMMLTTIGPPAPLNASLPATGTAVALSDGTGGGGTGADDGSLGGTAAPLSPALVSIPHSIKDAFVKGRTHFLASEEVYDLLLNGRQYGLPLSTCPENHPKPGSMYLFDRSRTARFRCDGYEWRRRETHAKRKVGDEYKLNCYYVGGPEDAVQRRCYWMLDDKASDLVFVHYLPAPPGKAPWGIPASGGEGSDGEEGILDDAGAAAAMAMAQSMIPGYTGETSMAMMPQNGGNVMVEVQELPAALHMPMPLGLGNAANMQIPLMQPYQAMLMQQAEAAAQQMAQGQVAQQQILQQVAPPREAVPQPPVVVQTVTTVAGCGAAATGEAAVGAPAPTSDAIEGDIKAPLRQCIAAADLTDPDSMFNAMCSLHLVGGISKQEQAVVCQLWMDNVLDDKQKKQLFMYIKNNLEDDEAVSDWVKSVIRKNGG